MAQAAAAREELHARMRACVRACVRALRGRMCAAFSTIGNNIGATAAFGKAQVSACWDGGAVSAMPVYGLGRESCC